MHNMLLILVILASPDLSLQWHGSDNKSLLVNVANAMPEASSCVSSGGQARFRYRLQLCYSPGLLFSRCADQFLLRKLVGYDAVADNHLVTTYAVAHGKGTVIRESSLNKALQEVASVGPVSLEELGLEKLKKADGSLPSLTLVVRLTTDCYGDYSETLASIGYFLSLGLIRFSQQDTGWIRFVLNDINTGNRDQR